MKSQRVLSITAILLVLLLLIGAAIFLILPRHSERLIDGGTRWEIHHQTGFRIAGRGFRATFTGHTPHWTHPTPFQQELEQYLHDSMTLDAADFGDYVTGSELLDALQESMASMDWEASVDDTVELDEPELISVLHTAWEYTGGAHGNTVLTGLNFTRIDGQCVQLRLTDLLDVDKVHTLLRLRHMIAADLKHQGATAMNQYTPGDLNDPANAGEPPLTPDDIQQFTLIPDGLRFHFSPYAVGSYAEGSYTVTLPWDKVRELLKPGTALTRWLDQRDAAESAGQ